MEALVLSAILGAMGGIQHPCVPLVEKLRSGPDLVLVLARGAQDGVEVGWKVKVDGWLPDGVYAVVKRVSRTEIVAKFVGGDCSGDPPPTCFYLTPP